MESQGAIWEDPHCAFRVEWVPEKLDRARISVMDAFYALPRGGIEIGGLLLGSYREKVVRIEEFEAIACEHLTGPSFVLSEKDHAELAKRIEKHGPAVMGWFHSHTRSDISFSPQDSNVHETYFPRPYQVAMVMRPANLQPLRANYFFRSRMGTFLAGAEAFSVEPVRMKSTRVARESVTGETGEADVTMPPASQTLPSPAVAPPVPAAAQAMPLARDPPAPFTPRFLEEPPVRRRGFLFLLTAFVIFALSVAAFLTKDLWLPPQVEPLALRATDVDGKLIVRWNPVRGETSGELHIMDGTKRTDVTLDAVQLARGIFAYTRESAIEIVRMKVGAREETTNFAGPLLEKPVQP